MITRKEFESMYKKYHEALVNYCWGKTGSQEDAEDLAQDVFVKAMEKVVDFDNPDKAYSWLCGIADKLRANKINKKAFREVSLDALIKNYGCKDSNNADEIPQLIDESQDVEKAVEKRELWEMIEMLPKGEKEVMTLVSTGMTQMEISQELGIPRETVRDKIHRASKKLRNQLEG